jgi:hypothetical protein
MAARRNANNGLKIVKSAFVSNAASYIRRLG